MSNTSLTARGGALPARGFSPLLSAAPSSRACAATTPAPPTAPDGAVSTTHEQRWPPRPRIHPVIPADAPESPLPTADLGADAPRVTGYGPSAQAALVDALMEAGEAEVAWKVAACGAMLRIMVHHVTVHSRGGNRRHLGGLAHCGRFQVCPCCTPYLMARRLETLTPLGARLAADPGLRHFAIVLTLRHRAGADWKQLVAVLRRMQAALRRAHPWRSAVAGYIRLMESTYTRNGHHPHEHLILTLRADAAWDAAGFFAWLKDLCERQARKAGRTCEWTGDWWSEIAPERLGRALHYFGTAEKMGTTGANPLMELSTSTKHQPLWCIPATPYAEVYRASHYMRWFAVGGCWRTGKTDQTDEELDAEREQMGTVIAHVPGAVWRAWTPHERRDRRAVVHDRSLTDAQIVELVIAWGGLAGPPSLPDWGAQILRPDNPPPQTAG